MPNQEDGDYRVLKRGHKLGVKFKKNDDIDPEDEYGPMGKAFQMDIDLSPEMSPVETKDNFFAEQNEKK